MHRAPAPERGALLAALLALAALVAPGLAAPVPSPSPPPPASPEGVRFPSEGPTAVPGAVAILGERSLGRWGPYLPRLPQHPAPLAGGRPAQRDARACAHPAVQAGAASPPSPLAAWGPAACTSGRAAPPPAGADRLVQRQAGWPTTLCPLCWRAAAAGAGWPPAPMPTEAPARWTHLDAASEQTAPSPAVRPPQRSVLFCLCVPCYAVAARLLTAAPPVAARAG